MLCSTVADSTIGTAMQIALSARQTIDAAPIQPSSRRL
jgi:hypothetical protein